MKLRAYAPALVALAGGCFFAAYGYLALRYSTRAAAVPLVVALPALALCLLQARAELRSAGAARPTSAGVDFGRLLQTWLWFLGFVAAVVLLGIAAGVFIMIVAYLILVAHTGTVRAVLAATVFSAGVVVLVEVVLDMPLDKGVLPVFANQ